MNVLDIENLSVSYGDFQAVSHVDLRVAAQEIVGIVGESGSGKSSLALAVPGLLGPGAAISADTFLVNGQARGATQRGPGVAMVFQDPASSFSPYVRIGHQLQSFLWREKYSRAAKRARITGLMTRLGIADAERRFDLYPHQFSGGMLQRMAIAAALLMQPKLVVADEPTTALDVTTEAQILHLLRHMRDEFGTAILLITHHLGLVAQLCDRVLVMYAGRIVEQGRVVDVFAHPAHPYTRALLACEPGLLPAGQSRLPVIPGHVPRTKLPGCAFAPRCAQAEPACATAPPWRGTDHAYFCHRVAA